MKPPSPSTAPRAGLFSFPRISRGVLTLAAFALSLGLASVDAAGQQPAPSAERPPLHPVKLPALPAAFKHPGLLHTKESLEFTKKKIAAGEEPWK
ncbi:MAG TPA: hypothetical protein VIO38_02740, partial [Rariglobus sp.]